jgi:hypothetical protein
VSAFADAGVLLFRGESMNIAPAYRTDAEIEDVVKRFEECAYSPEEFVHAKHLTVAAWYFCRLEPEVAREKMRTGLRRFIAHHGKNGFHVTITEFWLQIVERSVRQRKDDHRGLVSIVNEIVEQFRDKDLIYQYFSWDQLNSVEAKAAWLKPDIKTID